MDARDAAVGRDLGFEPLFDDPREGVERHRERVRRLAIEPRIADGQDVDFGRPELDRNRDRGVIRNAAVDVLAAADGDGRKHPGDRAAREEGGHRRSRGEDRRPPALQLRGHDVKGHGRLLEAHEGHVSLEDRAEA